MGLTPRYSTLSPALRDPWAGDPYEIGGSPYAESVYNEQYAEDTGWDGYGGWGGGWGGGWDWDVGMAPGDGAAPEATDQGADQGTGQGTGGTAAPEDGTGN